MMFPTPARPTLARVTLTAVAAALALLAVAPGAFGLTAVKPPLAAHLGANVNATKTKAGAPQFERDLCTVASADECVPAALGTGPGEFQSVRGVAAAGDVLVVDNERVQLLTPGGAFILALGGGVDQTTGANVCTALSKDTCGSGAAGQQTGAFSGPTAVAIDPSTGDMYVADTTNQRVQKFAANGEFLLMIGRQVNETKDAEPAATAAERNLCTAASKDVCKSGTAAESTEPSAFLVPETLAVGAGGVLYVGGLSQNLQEFEPDGAFKTELEVAPSKLAVDPASGDLYVHTEAERNVLRKLSPSGEELARLTLTPAVAIEGRFVVLEAVALDTAGHLAVAADERGLEGDAADRPFGALYDAATFARLSVIGAAFPVAGLAFTTGDELFATSNHGPSQELVAYGKPLPVAALTTGSSSCVPGPDAGSSATFACTFRGEISAEGVSETRAWFQWGRTPELEAETAPVPIGEPGAPVPVTATLPGLAPNATYYDQLVGDDRNSKAPELLSGETAAGTEAATVTTPVVAPRIVGGPSSFGVGVDAASLSGTLNPEHTLTRYHFEYAPCPVLAGCPAIQSTPEQSSPAYGAIGTDQEITDLTAGTTYSYRLVADSRFIASCEGGEPVEEEGHVGIVRCEGGTPLFAGGTAIGPEATFTTAPIPVLPPPPAGPSADTPPPEQPPAVLSSPAAPSLLAIPAIAFPVLPATPTSIPPTSNKHKLAAALRACRKLRRRARHRACERHAHRRYR